MPITPVAQNVIDDEINIRELMGVLWDGKWIILSVSILVAAISIVVTLRMPNVYQSRALLAPAEESTGGGLSAQFSGLASLAGVNLGMARTDKAVIALEVLKSRLFVTEFVKRRDLIVPLLAAKEWDSSAGLLKLDPDIYDAESQTWKGPHSQEKDGKRREWAAYKAFSQILLASQAKDTGLITLSINHVSPLYAQQWLEWLIADINQQMRLRDIEEATKSIEYLKQQLDQTPIAGVQQVFYQLIEKQMQTIMLANVRDQYVFEVIDPPQFPEEKHSPKRGMIVLMSVVMAFILSVAFVLVLNAFKKRNLS